MSNWNLCIEELEDAIKSFVKRKYNTFIYEDMEEAYDEIAIIMDLAEIALESIEQRLSELEEAIIE